MKFQNNILTRASRYSTLLSNVVSFSFSTASRERHDISVMEGKQKLCLSGFQKGPHGLLIKTRQTQL
jgi:hypothetical protein